MNVQDTKEEIMIYVEAIRDNKIAREIGLIISKRSKGMTYGKL